MVDICHIIKERELLLYPHIPLGVFRNSGEWPEPKQQYSLFLYTNDDSQRITEWIAYHQLIGINHFYIYAYHEDPTLFYQQLLPYLNASSPCVTYYHYPEPGNAHQAFCHFFRNYAHETKWILWLNIDEFLCFKKVDTIQEFMQPEYQEIDTIYFNLCHYGHNDFDTVPEGDILLNYTLRSNTISPLTRVMIQSTSLPYGKLYHTFSTEFQGNYTYLNQELSSMNVLEDDFSAYFKDYPKNINSYLNQENYSEQIIKTAYIAHFGLPSIQFLKDQKENNSFVSYGGQVFSEFENLENIIEYVDEFNLIEDKTLYDFWINTIISAWDHSIFPVNFWPLLSIDKPTTQSSTAHTCSVEEDACKLINGKLMGTAQNLTQIEENPWWKIDLQEISTIHEIQIFNRIDQNIKASCAFNILISTDEQIWKYITKKTNNQLYGGIDGSPYVWTSEKGMVGRFVKFTIVGNHKQIGLDQIQIFGETLNSNNIEK